MDPVEIFLYVLIIPIIVFVFMFWFVRHFLAKERRHRNSSAYSRTQLSSTSPVRIINEGGINTYIYSSPRREADGPVYGDTTIPRDQNQTTHHESVSTSSYSMGDRHPTCYRGGAPSAPYSEPVPEGGPLDGSATAPPSYSEAVLQQSIAPPSINDFEKLTPTPQL